MPSGRDYEYSYDGNGLTTSILTPAGFAHDLDWTALRMPASYTPPGSAGDYSRSYDAERKLTAAELPGGRHDRLRLRRRRAAGEPGRAGADHLASPMWAPRSAPRRS